MALYYLSHANGMDEIGKKHHGGGGIFHKKTAEEKAARKEKRHALLHKGLKVAEAPARGAFLLLLQLNALGLAKHFLKAYKQDPTTVTNWWLKLNGKPEKFKQAIAHGAKGSLSGLTELSIGGETVAVGIAVEAAIATATPIIIAAMALLKKMKVTKPSEEKELADAATEGAKQLNADAEDGADHVKAVDDKGTEVDPATGKPVKSQHGFFHWITHLFSKHE